MLNIVNTQHTRTSVDYNTSLQLLLRYSLLFKYITKSIKVNECEYTCMTIHLIKTEERRRQIHLNLEYNFSFIGQKVSIVETDI